VLAKLAVDSDQALQPLAKVSSRVADFIVQSNTVAQAGAATRGALARNLALFPPFLEQLGPALERVGRFAEQTTPTFTSLKVAAPGLDKAFTSLPAFSRSSEKFFVNLGQTAKVTGPALVGVRQLLKRLETLGKAAVPFTTNFSQLFENLRNTGGLERIMDFIFLGTSSANGYDALGHFLRAEGVGNACLKFNVVPSSDAGCRRKLFSNSGTVASAGNAPNASSAIAGSGTSVLMARTLAVLKGATPAQALAKYPGATTTSEGEAPAPPVPATSGSPEPSATPVGGSTAGTTFYTPPSEGSEADGLLLKYLLGNE
jgi:hypothetical protein